MILPLVKYIFDRLGPGRREHIYQSALSHLLHKNNIEHVCEHTYPILLDNHPVGYGRLDIYIPGQCILELKITPISLTHKAQAAAYANDFNLPVMIISFTKNVQTHLIGQPCKLLEDS